MIKKDYFKPEIKFVEDELDQQILTSSVTSSGLGDDKLNFADEDADSWDKAW